MRTRRQFGSRVDVQVQAFFAIGTVLGTCIMVTFGHAPSVEVELVRTAVADDLRRVSVLGQSALFHSQVVLMQEFALIALFA